MSSPRQANIVVLAKDPNDPANSALYESMPSGSKVVATVSSMEEFAEVDEETVKGVNVLFTSWSNKEVVTEALNRFPSVEWVHARSAGVEHIICPALVSHPCKLTNARGCFSSTLAEYTMMSCSYFAKDLPRLMRQKADRKWDQYCVKELRGSTLGVVGYGDIGKACARLAKAYGMRIVALKRNPVEDDVADVCYGGDGLGTLMSECDYVVVAAPLTEKTRGMVGEKALGMAKKGSVLINLGRGPIVDEKAMIKALESGRLGGLALDVFETEPLPEDHELWGLDNVLLSPHNMDMTETFMEEATEAFKTGWLVKFLAGEDVGGFPNLVQKEEGY
jgi:phosphoglycerate dehydrogenase-like enzyme